MQRRDRRACARECPRAYHVRQRRDDANVLHHRLHRGIQGTQRGVAFTTPWLQRRRPVPSLSCVMRSGRMRARMLEPGVGMDEVQVAHAIVYSLPRARLLCHASSTATIVLLPARIRQQMYIERTRPRYM